MTNGECYREKKYFPKISSCCPQNSGRVEDSIQQWGLSRFIASATTSGEEMKGNMKKEIICISCKKVVHYSSKCDKEDTV